MRFGTVRGWLLDAKRHKPVKLPGLVLGAFLRKNKKMQFEKASKTQCKIMLKFETKGVQKRSQNVIGNQGFA